MLRPTDAELVPGLIAKDEQAVSLLLDRYWVRAYRVAYQLTRDPGSAEDVAQETFVRVLERIGELKDPTRFRGWFFRILENTAKLDLRSSKRRREREEKVARPEATAAGAPDDEAGIVREHLGRLPDPVRFALTLRYLEELTLAEVAESLGCPEGTVSSRIRRGLSSLRASLQPVLGAGALGGVAWLTTALAVDAPQIPASVEVLSAVATTAVPLGAVPQAPAAEALVATGLTTSRKLPLLLGLVGAATLTAGTAWLGLSDDEVALPPPGPQLAAAQSGPAAPPAGDRPNGNSDDADVEGDAAPKAGPAKAGPAKAAKAGAKTPAPPAPRDGVTPALRTGEFAFHFKQGYSFATQRVVPPGAPDADVIFESCAGGISSVTLKAAVGLDHLDRWANSQKLRLRKGPKGLPFPRLALLEAVQGYEPVEKELAQIATGDDRNPDSDVFVLKTLAGAWVKLAIVHRWRYTGDWTKQKVTVRYVLNPTAPVFPRVGPGAWKFRRFFVDDRPVRAALQDPAPYRTQIEKDQLAADQKARARLAALDRAIAAQFGARVPAGARLGWVMRRDAAARAGARDPYRLATYSFEHATRDDPQGLTRNDWDLLFTGRGKLRIKTVTDDRSRIWDLGPGDLTAPLPTSLPAPSSEPPTPRAGHVYLIHTLDSNSDLWTRLQVLEVTKERLVFAWARAPQAGKLRAAAAQGKTMQTGTVRLQLRGGAGGGNPRRVYVDRTHSRVDALQTKPLDLRRKIDSHEDAHAYVEGGGLIPQGMVWVIDSVEVTALGAGDSNGHGEVLLQVGPIELLRLEEGKLRTATGERRTLAKTRRISTQLRGRIVLAPGQESQVYAEIANSSLCDVVLHGRFVRRPAAFVALPKARHLHRRLHFLLERGASPAQTVVGLKLGAKSETYLRTLLSFATESTYRSQLQAVLGALPR